MKCGCITMAEVLENIFKYGFDSDKSVFSKALEITEDRADLLISGKAEMTEAEKQELCKVLGVSIKDLDWWVIPAGNIWGMASKRKDLENVPWKNLIENAKK